MHQMLFYEGLYSKIKILRNTELQETTKAFLRLRSPASLKTMYLLTFIWQFIPSPSTIPSGIMQQSPLHALNL